MNVLKLFFAFRGRVNRAGFWLVSVTWFLLSGVLDYVWTATGAGDVQVGHNHWVDAAFVLMMAGPFASCVAISVRRLHDRNKSAWWLILFGLCPPLAETGAAVADLDSGPAVGLMALSIAISLWALVELGLLRGTVGPNRYGPDPLADAALISA